MKIREWEYQAPRKGAPYELDPQAPHEGAPHEFDPAPYDARGFTLVELLVATAVSTLVLGGAVALTSQLQNGYRRAIEASVAEQEGRYALDWIGKHIRGTGNNPFAVVVNTCPAADSGTPVEAIRFDPDGDGVDNDIRLQTDAYPPDGWIGGPGGGCTQAGEDITISFDAANNAILFFDNNLGGETAIRTDAVIDDLHFVYRDTNHAVTATPANVVYVETRITLRTRTIDAGTGLPATRTVTKEIRVRSR